MKIEKSNSKILGFDSWTKGARHFQRLVPALAERGITLTLVHLGSWGNDPERPSHENIGALEIHDISFYRNNSLENILDREQPDAVIFLSTRTFAHRALLRYCQQRSIPTLNLYHGLVNVQVTDNETGSYKIDRLAYAKFIYSKLGKLFKHTLPCYVGSLLKTKAKSKDWIRFISDVIRMAVGAPSLIAADDAKTSQCVVYTDADIGHAIRTYGFKLEDVFAVGNPDLLQFGLCQELIGSCLTRSKPTSREIMYIDTGLATVGLMFKSEGSFVEHLKATADGLSSQGIKMLFKPKPHPAHHAKFLSEQLRETDIELVGNDTFLQKLKGCTACIVETTTLALVPALMGMPLLFANYNELNDLRFGPVLTSYPRGYMLQDVASVSDILRKDSEHFDPQAINDWIAVNAGPLPAEKMPERVADIVASMIRDATEK